MIAVLCEDCDYGHGDQKIVPMIVALLLIENQGILRGLRSLSRSQYRLKNCVFVRTMIMNTVLTKTQKREIFVRNAIMIIVAVLIKRTTIMTAALIKTQKYDMFVRTATHSPINTKKHCIFVRTGIIFTILIKTRNKIFFVRTAIMIIILYIPAVRIFETVHFFQVITARHLYLLSLRSASALDMWACVIGLRKM